MWKGVFSFGPGSEVMSKLVGLLAALSGVFVAKASQGLTTRSVSSFQSSIHEDSGLRFVRDSGVCETTPGVHQLSGYIETGPSMSTVRMLVYEKNKNVA